MNTSHIADFVAVLQSVATYPHDGTPVSPEQRESAIMGAVELLNALRTVQETTPKLEAYARNLTGGAKPSPNSDVCLMFYGASNINEATRRDHTTNSHNDVASNPPRAIGEFIDACNNIHANEAVSWRKALHGDK